MSKKIRVGIAGSETFFQRGIALHLSEQGDMEVVGETAVWSDAIRFAPELSPDVLILDLKNAADAFDVIEAIRGSGSQMRILAVSVSEDGDLVTAAMRDQIEGYALRSVTGRNLLQVIRMVHAGQRYLMPSLAYAHLRKHEKQKLEQSQRDPVSRSTPRERDVLTIMVEGRSNKEIGRRLDLREKTVKHHVTNILQKLQASNRVQAVLMVSSRQNVKDRAIHVI